MPDSVDLPSLQSAENLGRGVFSGRRARRAAKGTIDHRAFLETIEAESLSVDRLDYASDETMIAIADQTAGLRGDDFHGWSVVTVEDASKDERTVKATPMLLNPYHADIELNVPDSAERRDEQKKHAVALANHASWRKRT
jgi:hypothetical protein